MAVFSIAFVAPDEAATLLHKIIEADDKNSAMKLFFQQNAGKYYSDDDKGFHYFKEDFLHPQEPAGSIMEIN